jgi:hypothetical protein
VLDHGSPEGPGIGDDDPDLHENRLFRTAVFTSRVDSGA